MQQCILWILLIYMSLPITQIYWVLHNNAFCGYFWSTCHCQLHKYIECCITMHSVGTFNLHVTVNYINILSVA
jgi:hypothetical protein